jgi:hypothetical protein
MVARCPERTARQDGSLNAAPGRLTVAVGSAMVPRFDRPVVLELREQS